MVMTTEGIHTPSPGPFFLCCVCVFIYGIIHVH